MVFHHCSRGLQIKNKPHLEIRNGCCFFNQKERKERLLQKQLSGPDHFASVFKEVRNGNIITSKADPKTYRDAYYSPVSVGDQIFVLYNGKMVEDPDYNLLCKELFVIGWDGSLICRYTLDQGVSNITVDSQHRKIYGISDDPEYHIVEFEY